jgi:hypothetical protein
MMEQGYHSLDAKYLDRRKEHGGPKRRVGRTGLASHVTWAKNSKSWQISVSNDVRILGSLIRELKA